MNRGRGRFNEPYGDDQPTQYIGNPRSDQPTEYLGGPNPGTADGYNPDADFAGGGSNESANETRFDIPHEPTAATEMYRGAAAGSRGGAREDTGQYWAPLTPAEQGYAEAGPGGGNQMPPRQHNTPKRKNNSGNSGGSGWGKSAAVVSVVAILAILVLVILVMNFVSSSDSAQPSSAPAPTPSTSTVPSTEPSTSAPTESSPITDAQNRVQEEIDRLRENPPALPGVGDVTSGWGTIPVGVAGKSPAVVQAELAANGYLNVKVFDRNGVETNSAANALGKVASIDPPEGQAATTDTQVNIYLQ